MKDLKQGLKEGAIFGLVVMAVSLLALHLIAYYTDILL
jgi:hypothetical protein